MNEYDSNRIYDLVKEIGYIKTEKPDEANCYIINTCHIREKATDKVYHDVGRVKKNFRNRKKPIVIITGCVAQAEGEILLKKEKYIDAVVGPQSYHRLSETLKKIESNSISIDSTEFEVVEKFDNLNLIKNSNSNISSFLTIQEGCDKFCKFCVVPYTRGAEFSRSIKEILNECQDLINNGAKEITLLGQNVNAFNYGGNKLSTLLSKINKLDRIRRIRYTTSHPLDFSNDLIEAHATLEKLMPLIHLPIQSGSNRILKSMNRKHSVEDYLNLVNKLKRLNPAIRFSSDFIIGYPGETDKDFNYTLKLLKEVEFINSYSFIFSPRPGTPASKMETIDENLAKERLKIFQKSAGELKTRYRKELFNKKSSVLFENQLKGKENEFFGRDEYLNSVIVKSHSDLVGKIKEVDILEGNQNTLYGKIEKKFKNFAA